MIELHPHAAFTEQIEPVPDWMCGDRSSDFTPFVHMLPAVEGDYTRHLLDEHLCPLCGEIIDGPECGHDWAAIAAVEQADKPIIDMRGRT